MRALLSVVVLAAASCTSASGLARPLETSTTRPVTTTVIRPPTTTTVPRPPYPLIETTLRLVDRSRPTVSGGRTLSPTRALTTLVWAPKRPGRWPLVVFAHGYQVGPGPYAALLEGWAAHGYVVAAPEFPLTDEAVAGAALDEADIDNQPADVRFVTDYLVGPSSPVRARIDPGRVAVAGHSDGAETALAAATDPTPPGGPRYRCVVVMGVQPVAGAAGRNPPILVAQGDADTINPPGYGTATWQQAASPKYLLILQGGGHLPPLEAGSAWFAGIEAVTEAFLDAYTAGTAVPASIPRAAAGRPGLVIQLG